MKISIETKNGKFDVENNNVVIYSGFENFHDDGYYFNYCIMVFYEKNMRCNFSYLDEINKIICVNDFETIEFEKLERIGGLSHSGIVGYNDGIKKQELIKLLEKNNFNDILKSYFNDRYEKLYNSIKEDLISKIDLNCQINLNIYLSLNK